MAKNPIYSSPNSTPKFIDLPKSKGILDDYAVRKNIATKEGTIEHKPTADNHIVNKGFCDSTYVNSAGDTMTGALTVSMGGNPYMVLEEAYNGWTTTWGFDGSAMTFSVMTETSPYSFELTESTLSYISGGSSIVFSPTSLTFTDNIAGAGSTVNIRADDGTGNNANGGKMNIESGYSTGTGTGSIDLSVARGGTSGSTANTPAVAVRVAGATSGNGFTVTLSDKADIALNTSTGSKIGTATTQKLGFYNATPIVQPANTVALDTALINLGLKASGDTMFYQDTYFTGAGSGLPYGACYGTGINWTQTSAAQNTWYLVSDADMNDAPLNMITHDGSGKLTVSKAGVYKIDMAISMQCSGTNKHIEYGVSQNGASPVMYQREYLGAVSEDQHGSLSRLISCSANDTLELAVRTTDTGTPNITVDNLSITCVQVGG